MRFKSALFVLSLIRIIQGQGNSLTFSPSSPLCIGEGVQMVCYVVSPTTDQFIDDTAQISFNGSIAGNINAINVNGIVDADTTRYTADFTGLTISTDRPGIRLTITNYQASDGATNFSCHGLYSSANGGVSPVFISGYPQTLADAPLSFVLTLSQTDTSCSIILTWSPPVSDRSITYSVYRDGVTISDVSNTSTEYTENDLIDVTTVHTYYIVATSCAGDATSNTVSSESIGVPSSPVLSLSQTDNCSSLLINWSTLSDRPITSYSVYRDSTSIYIGLDETTDNIQLSISTVYEYSIRAISCAGNSTAEVSVKLEYNISSLTVTYEPTSGETVLIWVLSTDISLQPVSLSFFIMYNYNHTQGNETVPSPPLTDTFSLISDVTSYDISKDISRPSFTGEGEIETEIWVCIYLTEQCGQTVPGEMMCNHSVTPSRFSPPCLLRCLIPVVVCVCCCCCSCCLTGVIIFIIVLKKKDSKKKESDSQKLQEEKPYSKVDKDYKKPKVQPKVQPPAKEMKGNYVDLQEFPLSDNLKKHEPVQETLYTTVQPSSHRSNY